MLARVTVTVMSALSVSHLQPLSRSSAQLVVVLRARHEPAPLCLYNSVDFGCLDHVGDTAVVRALMIRTHDLNQDPTVPSMLVHAHLAP